MKYYYKTLYLTCAYALCLFACQKSVDKIKPGVRDLTEAVYASAVVRAEGQYQVYSDVNGMIESLNIEEGQVVAAGSLLAQLDDANAIQNVQRAHLNAQLARQNYERQKSMLKGIADEVESARLKLETDSINYFRQKRLLDKQIGSKEQYESRKLNYELAQNQLSLLQNQYSRTKDEMNEQLNTQIDIANSNISSSRLTNEDFKIRAQQGGRIYAVYKEAGEAISLQEPLALIGASDSFIIEMEVDEVDIARLRVSQKMLISLDAYGQQVFEGQLSKIYPLKQERTQTFKVEGRFKKQPEVLYPGLSGEANIVVSERKSVLTIPLAYLINEQQVQTEEGLINIQTGIRDMEHIEVVSGIDSSTYIIRPE